MQKNIRDGIITIFFALAVFTAFFLAGKVLQPPLKSQAFVDVYGTVPPGFPAGLVPAATPLTTSRSTRDTTGSRLDVSYQSHDPLPSVYAGLLQNLQDKGWKLNSQTLNATAQISASKDGATLLALVAPANDRLSLVVTLTYIPKK